MGYIYLRPNLLNGKKYVGQMSEKQFKKRQNRWNDLNVPYAGPAINNARKKYGLSAFGFEILKECSDDELDYWEMYYIEKLDTKAPNGYNLTEGGGGHRGYVQSEETKRKMSESHTGKPRSEKTKRKISESNINGKCSKAVLQIDMTTNEVIAEFPSAMEVQRQLGFNHGHISKCCLGKLNYVYNFIWRYKEDGWLDELLQKYDDCRRKKNGKCSKAVLQIDMTTNEVIAEFASTREVERQLGFNNGHISKCCLGRPYYKTAYGFIWRYKESAA